MFFFLVWFVHNFKYFHIFSTMARWLGPVFLVVSFKQTNVKNIQNNIDELCNYEYYKK
uniref:Uncharacterized protein n=1 Tax=Anguilla anguilla TaxID=7936 RepID=A0A0E9Q6V1_ANGAN